MYEKELQRILNASQNNALTFFVGAGVSALSGAPTWKGLIQAISNQLGQEKKEEYSSDEYLQIPQMFYYSLGENRDQYYEFVKAQLHSSNLVPNAIHREMLNLNPISFITTNYDTLLEDAAIQYCQSFKVIRCDEDVPTILGDRFILKLHGDFKYNNLVLKEEDYLNYGENFKLIETLAKSIFSTNTVVFIGYSLSDYNIKLILNWVKALLKDKFQAPIFLYLGDHDLTKVEINYHQSRGLAVVELNKLNPQTVGRLDRYQSIFTALKNQSKLFLDGKSEDEAFEILYELLRPLNRLYALRIGDVSKRLYPYNISIRGDGVIYLPENDNLLLKKFFAINQIPEDEQNRLQKNILRKYRCILAVFQKARIFYVMDEKRVKQFIAGEIPFADRSCILFNYMYMQAFAAKTYATPEKNYKKAFYLSRLKQYDEAFFIFSEVAKQAFKNKDYLLYYLAESNCISLRKIIKDVNIYHRCYDLDAVEAVSPNDFEIENLFRRLPVEFRNTYETLADLHSVNMLYKYSYEASVDEQKLQKVVESGAIEFGLTSRGKVTFRINDYLHFLLGNGIIADVFAEYVNTVKKLMSMLVYKYSAQSKEVLHERPFPFKNRDEVYFDEIDFYCFIECFDAKGIITLLNKYHIETIEFRNMDLIEIAVNNLLDYYNSVVKTSKSSLSIINLQVQIKTCLALLRHVNISQCLVDKICDFILTQEFREILINDKILFLDFQLARRNMYSKTTSKIIESTLISYLNRHIAALKNGGKFELLSSNTAINYCNLVNYISPPNEEYHSKKLAARVSQIINYNLTEMYPQIERNYWRYVSKSQKKKLVTWANKLLCKQFDFGVFTMLVEMRARISNAVKTQLKAFLKEKVSSAKTVSGSNGVMTYPAHPPYSELNEVGYWCMLNVLKAKDFREFLGNSAEFDFYCEYTQFDFSRFNVSWLLNLYSHTLEQIAKNAKVKEHVRVAIAKALKEKNIASDDRQKLQNILVNYFC